MKRKSAITRTTRRENTNEEAEKELVRLGERIKQLRIEKGYTSYEIFAFENGINRAQFGRYERGEDLRYTSLLKVIRALGLTPKEFFSKGFD